MKIMKRKLTAFGIFACFLVLFACNSNTTSTSSGGAGIDQSELKGQSGVIDEESEPHILNIAIGSKDHTTLVAAVQAAGLEDVLTNAGPLTVFAPTNEAFEKLPEGTVETLLKPENKETLANIITFHAAPGSYGANNIRGVMGIGQATGDKVDVQVKDGVTYVNGAKVLGTVKASNGIVHVIDQVLLPPEK
jgi:uncharacterized surface protein with fasciclin (FAS1) repeats